MEILGCERKVYAFLQAPSEDDQMETDLSPKKFHTEELPALPKVCDNDCISK